jgi:hypothetical protein
MIVTHLLLMGFFEASPEPPAGDYAPVVGMMANMGTLMGRM